MGLVDKVKEIGFKVKLSLDVFGEKKLKKIHPSQQERTDWTEDVIRKKEARNGKSI